MVRMRLRRMGAKKHPFYRIVVADQRRARNGRFIEVVGTYDPMTDPGTIKFDEEKTKYWLGVGAQPSETVNKLLVISGLAENKN